ncbi:sensor domain-containing phosphodiesterase [Bordetella genomosp. 5]|uniref:putative bifunctional diguanylate cyclase/phosphodiesterase n=1 Tax=Bordetella genomosp. 5 TaxID=1395608 RepID=UPI000B9DF548|nr:GGDEF and EAL domain-containing protein [Bordetella genomosp. 5]OZI42528.1 sensor domain-containing phosphodiesterase [Bordetella genomosp. 5]
MSITPALPHPANEAERQACLDLFDLDGEHDEVLSEIVALAARLFDAPVALLSIIDRHRQWFKARIGTSVEHTPRGDALCEHTIAGDGVLEVCDARRDPRYARSVAVTGELQAGYYAGTPLVTRDGFALGTLCVIDRDARQPMSARERETLAHFGRLALARLMTIRHTRYIDEPTGLFNRLRLEQDVALLLGEGRPLEVVTADLLPIELANAFIRTLGYPFFNQLMADVRDRMRGAVPAECVLYKISPTRFAFLVVEGSGVDVERVAADLQRAFHLPVVCQSIPVRTGLGLGVLPLKPGIDYGDWIRLAVSAAEDARQHNLGLAYFRPEVDQAQQRAQALLAALSAEVSDCANFSLAFQPKLVLDTGRCDSVEALLRWNHPELGCVSPSEFLPLAENTALMNDITRWVLRAAVDQLSRWREAGVPLSLAVNISARDLEDTTLVADIMALLREAGVDPARLELEFTESAWIQDEPAALRTVQHAQGAGLSVAIDDFGTGYSNWTYLLRFPATSVKMDRTLIEDIETSETHRTVVRTVVQMARRLGLRVVGEGVESAAQRDFLRDCGCNEAQGFLFAHPMNATQLEAWLETCGA